MLFLFLFSCYSFPIKGIWNVTFHGYKASEQNFRLRFSLQNTTFVANVRPSQAHQMIPKKIHVKELVPDSRYVLITPFNENPKFAEFWFKNETGILKSTVNSTNNQWNVTVTVIPGESIQVYLKKFGNKNIWYSYNLSSFDKQSSVLPLIIDAILIIVIVIVIIVICRCFTRKPNTKKD